MATWTPVELDKIGAAEELRISTFRRDGTLRNPVTIWVVRYDDDLYIRSAHGATATWFRGTQARSDGHIQAGGIDKDVNFQSVDPALNDQIDAVYRTKYRRHGAQYVNMVVTADARATTLKLMPRS
ncbi:MAG: DUF2255 family protein [Rhodopila sp.]|nr:DUF2255 family protein [Rhodopila sp.]